jgi:hypothetical protein
MIEVSELAGIAMVGSLRDSGVGEDQGFRLTKRNDQFTLEIDTPADVDRVLKHQDAIALIVDPSIESEVGDIIIDVEERPEGPQLMMRSKPIEE